MRIQDFIEKSGIEANIYLIGFHVGDEWKHDLWNVEIKRWSLSYEFTYKTGTGHRRSAGPMVSGRDKVGVNIAQQLDKSYFVERGKRFMAQRPELAPIFDCLRSDATALEQTFEEWCDEIGQDTDSRAAFATYEACVKTGQQLIRLFGLRGLAELLECEGE